MSIPLRALLLEDSFADSGLILHELQRAGFAVRRGIASNAAEFAALLGQAWDIVLADYRLTDFTAIDALDLLRARRIDTPLIVVTGTLGDEEAARCMRLGAVDFLLKDRLQRLGAAVTRALDDHRQRDAAKVALRHSEQRFRDIAEIAADIIWEADTAQRLTFLKGGSGELAGRPFAALIGQCCWSRPLAAATDAAELQAHQATVAARRPFRRLHLVLSTPDGRAQHVTVNGRPFLGTDGAFAGYRGTLTDDTAAREALQRLRESEQQSRRLAAELSEQYELLRVTLQSIGDGVITTDAEGRVAWLNPVAERLTGWPSHDAAGRPVTEVFRIVHELTRLPVDDPVAACLTQGRITGLAEQTVLISRSGQDFAVEDSAAPIRGASGTTLGAVLVFHDITEKRQLTGEMSYRAAHDALTALLNRDAFEARLRQALGRAQADRSQHALIYIDLDQFKVINDSCGHAAGDQMLQQVARRLRELVRAGDAVARLGGDEFAILLEQCSGEQAQQLAQQICEQFDAFRFSQGEQRFRVSASIGLVPIDARWPSTAGILQAADSSCYAAKEAGRNRVHCWSDGDEAMHLRLGETQWAARLAQALDEDRFVLFAQRLCRLTETEAGLHAEVLLRMVEADGTLAPPGLFLPAAERFHLASRLDRWVLTRVTGRMAVPETLARIEMLCVNLSGQSVSDSAFQTWAIAMLRDAGPQICRRLCLEITETAAVTNMAEAARFTEQLRAVGVRVALDDFGAGASSFGYLKKLPVDFLKIDGQFIRDLVTDPLDEVAVRCFVDVAAAVGLQTVAEFVDRPEVLAKLRRMGVDLAQGYLLHRPEPIEALLQAPITAAADATG
jgi:diguanylate cyclase (GGDEF)-like protein/PAS domain S-box-containing protein